MTTEELWLRQIADNPQQFTKEAIANTCKQIADVFAAMNAKIDTWERRYDGGLMFGEIAAINGQGPCERCVGRALQSPPSDGGSDPNPEGKL